MISSPRRSTLNPPVTRHFEFTRLQDRLIAIAYQSLIRMALGIDITPLSSSVCAPHCAVP